jgi:hypothetical protein
MVLGVDTSIATPREGFTEAFTISPSTGTRTRQLYLQPVDANNPLIKDLNAKRAEIGMQPLSQEELGFFAFDTGNVSRDPQLFDLRAENLEVVSGPGFEFLGGQAGATVPGEVAPVPTAEQNLASAAAEQAAVNTAAENLAAAQAENARLIAESRAQNALLGIDDDEALARQAERRGGTPSALLTATKTTGLLGG